MNRMVQHLAQSWRRVPRPARIVLARIVLIPPQLFGILLVTFVLVRMLPGDPALLLLGNMATPEAIASLRQKLGLDQGLWTQFIRYLGLQKALHRKVEELAARVEELAASGGGSARDSRPR